MINGALLGRLLVTLLIFTILEISNTHIIQKINNKQI